LRESKKAKKLKKKKTKGKRRKEMVNEAHRDGGFYFSIFLELETR